jgi:hypothetical protein
MRRAAPFPLYTDSGEFDRYLMLPHNPNMVIVDTKVVAGAPARLLAAGLAMRWRPGLKHAPVRAAAQPPWRAANARRRL